MSEAGPRLVDGRGAERVTSVLFALTELRAVHGLVLRRASGAHYPRLSLLRERPSACAPMATPSVDRCGGSVQDD